MARGSTRQPGAQRGARLRAVWQLWQGLAGAWSHGPGAALPPLAGFHSEAREDPFEGFARARASDAWGVARRLVEDGPARVDVVREALDRSWQAGLAAPEEVRALALVAVFDRRAERGDRPVDLADLLPRFLADGHLTETARPWSDDALARLASDARALELITRLPNPHRSALVLRDVAGLAAKPAARALGVPVAELRRTLHRARLALRTLIEQVLAEHD